MKSPLDTALSGAPGHSTDARRHRMLDDGAANYIVLPAICWCLAIAETFGALLDMPRMPAVFERVDALICPAAVGPAPDASTTGNPAFNSPWSLTALPTICFPIALAPSGLPLGVQIVGKAYGEASLFRAAQWCEERVRDELG